MNTCRCVLGAAALLLLFAGIARAETVTLDLDAWDRGCYYQNSSDTGYHNPGSNNYMVGRYTTGLTSEYHNFYIFDLSGITGDITSATLKVNVLGIVTAAESETYELYHVETPVNDLIVGGSDLSDIYADLGSGTVYGSREIFASETGMIEISLDVDLLSNSIDGDGKLAIGGALTTLVLAGTADEYVFGYPGEKPLDFSQLVVETIPEPGTAVLILMGGAAMFAFTRVRRMRRV